MTASGVRMGEAIGTAGDEQGAERQRRGISDRSEGRERKAGGLLLGRMSGTSIALRRLKTVQAWRKRLNEFKAARLTCLGCGGKDAVFCPA
jgi:hypothetical protein